MAKLAREQALRERRARKQEKKQAAAAQRADAAAASAAGTVTDAGLGEVGRAMTTRPERVHAYGDAAPSSPSATRGQSQRRYAFCPLCGKERREILASVVRGPEDALCPGRCGAAWRILVALRLRESSSERVAARRQSEYQDQQPHLPALSELLLLRWREGDWAVSPEDLLAQIQSTEHAGG